MSLPQASASRMGNLIVNPSGVSPTATETTLRDRAWWILDLSPLPVVTLRGESTLIRTVHPGHQNAFENV